MAKDHWKATVEGSQKQGHRVLMCIYNSPNAPNTVQCVLDTFAKHTNMSTSILGFTREPSAAAFADPQDYKKAKSENERIVTELVQDTHQSLLEGVFSEQAVARNVVQLRKESVAVKILEEQQRSPYDTVVAPGVKCLNRRVHHGQYCG